MPVSLFTAGLIAIQNNRILLTYSKNKKAWYLPGGKIEQYETGTDALIREIKEELQIDLKPERLQFYCHITAPAYGEEKDVIMQQSCFLYDITEPVKPSAEIEQVGYFDLATYLLEPARVTGVLQVFDKLAKDQLLLV